jgi:hypothetical protein
MWIYHTTLNCKDMGVTWVRLKRNQAPSRSALDAYLVPDAVVKSDRDQGSVQQSSRLEISIPDGSGLLAKFDNLRIAGSWTGTSKSCEMSDASRFNARLRESPKKAYIGVLREESEMLRGLV